MLRQVRTSPDVLAREVGFWIWNELRLEDARFGNANVVTNRGQLRATGQSEGQRLP